MTPVKYVLNDLSEARAAEEKLLRARQDEHNTIIRRPPSVSGFQRIHGAHKMPIHRHH